MEISTVFSGMDLDSAFLIGSLDGMKLKNQAIITFCGDKPPGQSVTAVRHS